MNRAERCPHPVVVIGDEDVIACGGELGEGLAENARATRSNQAVSVAQSRAPLVGIGYGSGTGR